MLDKPQDMTRRVFFRNMAAYALGVAAFLNLVPSLAKAQSKMSQQAAKYQDTPKAGHSCDKCTLFVSPDACKMVDGKISPQGWCLLFTQK